MLDPIVRQVIEKFESAYDSKAALGLHEGWAEFDDYYYGRVNLPINAEDPGSSTNIILPNIESQVADLVDQPWDVMAKGEEPSDQMFSTHVQHIMKWLLQKNKTLIKLARHETGRLKLGTGAWKIWYDPNAMRGKGLPILDSVSPVNIFPDPKVTMAEEMQEGDFLAHAMYKPLNWIKRHPIFGPMAKDLRPANSSVTRSIQLFEGEGSDELDTISKDKIFFLECWVKDLLDGVPFLRLFIVANETKIYDSKEDMKRSGSLNFYKHGKYPYVITPCYLNEGRLWGTGDVELLIPTQDLINDLDDQIRSNARLMGNIQKIIGISSGINPKKWTNKAGLNVVARDPSAWKMVEPPNMPAYIQNRRDMGFREAEIISGRSDIVEGRKPGSLRAAAAILALQEAGNRRANHKRMMLQAGMQEVMELMLDYVKEYFTEERAFRILNSKDNDYIWFRGSDLNTIPKLIPKSIFNPETGMEEHTLVPLMDDLGQKQITKDADFDLEFSIGAGLPTSVSFLYQATNELHQNGIVTTEEARLFLKNQMNWPIIDPLNPQGTFAGRNVPPEVTAQMNGQIPPGMEGQAFPQDGQPQGGDIPPEILQALMGAMGGGQ